MEVGNVALVAAAQLDAERGDQNEAGEAGGRTHHHLRRDPAAEIGADQHRVLKAQFAGEIEIQVGQVVDAARTAVDQRRRAIAGMRRRDHAIVPREQIEPWPLGRQPLAGVEKQQRPCPDRARPVRGWCRPVEWSGSRRGLKHTASAHCVPPHRVESSARRSKCSFIPWRAA